MFSRFVFTSIHLFIYGLSKCLQHRVIVLSGLQARKIIFNEPGFDIMQGYGMTLGSLPDLDDLSVETDGGERDGEFARRVLAILGKDRIKDRMHLQSVILRSYRF
jgi:sterol 14-demethylase